MLGGAGGPPLPLPDLDGSPASLGRASLSQPKPGVNIKNCNFHNVWRADRTRCSCQRTECVSNAIAERDCFGRASLLGNGRACHVRVDGHGQPVPLREALCDIGSCPPLRVVAVMNPKSAGWVEFQRTEAAGSETGERLCVTPPVEHALDRCKPLMRIGGRYLLLIDNRLRSNRRRALTLLLSRRNKNERSI